MFSLSKKEIINEPTTIYRKENTASFMSLSNQRFLTKKIYLLHRSNNGILGYLHFKESVPLRMRNWVQKQDANQYKQVINGSIDILTYLNKIFVHDNYDLYSIKYSNTVDVSYSIGDNAQDIVILKKKPEEIMACDYANMDVWTEQTTEATNNVRYNNKIPHWQRTMNIRHYDRNNQGFQHADSNRASLDTPVHGYGDEMKKLCKLSDSRLKAHQTANKY